MLYLPSQIDILKISPQSGEIQEGGNAVCHINIVVLLLDVMCLKMWQLNIQKQLYVKEANKVKAL